ncbi:hypothetical protein CL3_32830 [butyrate-producing bacterium SM4/1]|nr:hypothetical protein CL3_32830 [butyrate-producing bacterium SM4/1]
MPEWAGPWLSFLFCRKRCQVFADGNFAAQGRAKIRRKGSRKIQAFSCQRVGKGQEEGVE